MAEYGVAALYTVFLWWFSTGVILYLDGLPRGTFRWSMLGASAMLAAGLIGMRASADDPSALGAYCAFTCAILAWAWVETSFLTGFITGPSAEPCPPGAAGWTRFRLAVRALLHHELAILGLGAAIIAITWDQPNRLGLWTFVALWALRISAKLNLYLGARNLGEQLLPDHLRHLASFFRRAPMNLLFPVSITAATIACVLVFEAAAEAGEAGTGLTLLGVLLALGVLEHWFLMLPVQFERLWAWYLVRRERAALRRGGAASSFAAPLSDPCDAATLRQVLDAAAQGDFGEVERLSGLVRAADAAGGWIRFQITEGRAGMTALAAAEGEEPRVTATGRRLDGARLCAALQGPGLSAALPA